MNNIHCGEINFKYSKQAFVQEFRVIPFLQDIRKKELALKFAGRTDVIRDVQVRLQNCI